MWICFDCTWIQSNSTIILQSLKGHWWRVIGNVKHIWYRTQLTNSHSIIHTQIWSFISSTYWMMCILISDTIGLILKCLIRLWIIFLLKAGAECYRGSDRFEFVWVNLRQTHLGHINKIKYKHREQWSILVYSKTVSNNCYYYQCQFITVFF